MPNTVQVVPSHGKFTVRVIENGETSEREFEIESHAQAWASGQTQRLISTPVSDQRQSLTASSFPGDKIG